MPFVSTPPRPRIFAIAIGLTAMLAAAASPARSEALLVIEADSGKVLHAENATYPWYPASVTKVMTAYVTLRAVKEGRLTLDTPLTVSATAAAQQPSKMGFQPGTTVTVDNALKMLMVKSANDIAVVLAEGVAGSIEKFADEMNGAARRLGMTQSHYVNPNGLPAEEQVTSARDQAILARAIFREMPEYNHYWSLPGIKFGKRVMRNYNTLIDRYPGADGIKTGFICASGFNLLASATRNGKRLIAVVFGSPSSAVRAVKAAQLFERGFNSGPLSWLTPSLGSVDALVPIAAAPPNLREEMCGKHRKRPAAEELDDDEPAATAADSGSQHAIMLSALRAPATTKPSQLIAPAGPLLNPVVVYVGPAKKPAQAIASAGKPGRENPNGSARNGNDPGVVTASGAAWPSPAPSFVPNADFAAAPTRLFRAAAAPNAAVPMPRPRPKARPKP